MSFLGIDLGTSGLRALLLDGEGVPVGSAERSYAVLNPAPGWSEQEPQEWILALSDAIDELRARFRQFRGLKGIGVAGHMHGATLLDDAGQVLRPCILWNDTRSEAEAAELDALDEVRALSGNIVFPGFTAPKLAWVRAHEPELFGRTEKVLLPAAYLNYFLTGTYTADISDSSGTSWLDTGKRDWSARLLQAGHMRHDQMPDLVEGCEIAAPLRAELRRRWGLDQDVVVAGGAGDNAAAACGVGALNEGDGFVSLGTSGVILAARDSYAPAPETAVHTFCHAVPDRWYQMGVMLSATDSLNWLSRITGQRPAELTAELGGDLQAPGPVRFLPYLSGERTPHNDASVRGGLTGLAAGTGRADLTRAVLEGVAFGLRDLLEALTATGAQLETLTAIGGGAASEYWLKMIATTLQIPLQLPKGREYGAALGAARLAQIAVTGCRPEEVITRRGISSMISPDPSLSAAFDEAYQSFNSAYTGLKQSQ